MSQDEKDNERSFLSRWSQRKQEAKQPEAGGAAEKPDEEAGGSLRSVVPEDEDEQFDLSSLPKLEEITEKTDITGFLRKGVPESLRNAALRKSWALDPAIRNYVNPALDYAYDWNSPGGVPGHGELAVGTDVAKMVLQIMGGDPALQHAQDGAESSGSASEPIVEHGAAQNPATALPPDSVRLSVASTIQPASEEVGEYGQPDDPGSAKDVETIAPQQKVRRHGTAKPRI
jgi:hypothetical protein